MRAGTSGSTALELAAAEAAAAAEADDAAAAVSCLIAGDIRWGLLRVSRRRWRRLFTQRPMIYSVGSPAGVTGSPLPRPSSPPIKSHCGVMKLLWAGVQAGN